MADNMIMAWPWKIALKFGITVINVYKIKIAVSKLVYFSISVRST